MAHPINILGLLSKRTHGAPNTALLLSVLLTACSSTAINTTLPAVPAYTASVPSGFEQQTMTADWWQQFANQKLQQLINDALIHSPSLQGQQAKLQQAEYQQQAFDSNANLPHLNLELSPQRMRNNAAPLGMAGGSNTYNLYQARLVAQYNLDLSGGNQHALASYAASTDYQRYQLAGAKQTLISQLLLTAIQQAALSQQIQWQQQLILSQQQQLTLLQQQQNIGSRALPEILQNQQQLNQSQSELAKLQQAWQHSRHQLALLSGKSPSDSTLSQFEFSDFQQTNTLPTVLSSELLKQRPDIRAAEAMLHAAIAQHGVSVSKLYPQLNLSAALGSQAISSAALFGSGALIWSIAGQLLQPLFNPAIKHEIKANEAGQYAAAAHYQQTVLQAFQQVADRLRNIEASQTTAALSQQNLQLAQQQLNLIQQQQQIGSTNQMQYLQQQQQLLQQQMHHTTQQAQQLSDTVELYQAVGGVF